MDNKLQELTEKLFQEGVVKGNQKADEIVTDAQKKAQEIIANAEKEAQLLLENAQKKALELDKNTRSELQLASRQLINALEQEVANLVTGKVISESVQPALADKEFIQKLIYGAVTNWAPKQDLLVIVSPDDKAAVESFFASQSKQLLAQGVKIESVNKVKTGFQIGPVDGSYKVSFTSEDFLLFFQEFIRPKIVELLFGNK